MEKLLVYGRASVRDPELSEQMLLVGEGKVPFPEFFHAKGIKTIDTEVINSCHGDIDLTLRLANDQRQLNTENRVVVIQAGGLYFAKPSLEAAVTRTIPTISIPLDGGWFSGGDAYLAPMVPPGVAAIAGVGVEDYQTAAFIASELLLNDYEGVHLVNVPDKTRAIFEKLGVPILEGGSEKGLYFGVAPVDGSGYPNDEWLESFDEMGSVGFFALQKTDNPGALSQLMSIHGSLYRSAWVGREENLAYMAAKVLGKVEQLEAAGDKKAASYEQRTIDAQSFTGGEQ